jgi:DNA-binding PadR family transcriptional regulator
MRSSTGFELPDLDLRKVVDDLREAFAPRSAAAAEHDVRAAVLTELATEPMHGYQLIHAISERSAGTWTPTAGAIYPTLQLLADEGLVAAEQQGERKVWSLTDTGRAVADGLHAAPADATSSTGSSRGDRAALAKAGVKLAEALSLVGRHGTPAQRESAAAIVDEARKTLYSILAED